MSKISQILSYVFVCTLHISDCCLGVLELLHGVYSCVVKFFLIVDVILNPSHA